MIAQRSQHGSHQPPLRVRSFRSENTVGKWCTTHVMRPGSTGQVALVARGSLPAPGDRLVVSLRRSIHIDTALVAELIRLQTRARAVGIELLIRAPHRLAHLVDIYRLNETLAITTTRV